MKTIQTTPRDWHPIEADIIHFVDRYGLGTAAAAHAAKIKGMDSLANSEARLSALARRGDLVEVPCAPRGPCYTLSLSAHQRLGRIDVERYRKTLSLRTTAERYAMLAYCCLQSERRKKLVGYEIEERFPDVYRPGSVHRYYVTGGDAPRLGFFRADVGSFGRWDRIIAKISADISRHLEIALVRQLLDHNAFEIGVVTCLPEKARRIELAMKQRFAELPIPVRALAVPELINCLRPEPG